MARKRYGLVLCSGGVDSVTTAYYVKIALRYENVIILFFDYGQKSTRKEKECAKRCALQLGAKFVEMKLPVLGELSSSLINRTSDVHRVKRYELKDTRRESKNWYVPFRNTVFFAYALALAEKIYLESKQKFDIFVGFKYEGRGGFPDTSLSFIKDIEKISRSGYSGRFKITAPLIHKDKADIVLLGNKLGINFKDTFSCYIGKKKHCGYCLACRLRQEGFYWANVKDPTRYEIRMKDFRFAR